MIFKRRNTPDKPIRMSGNSLTDGDLHVLRALVIERDKPIPVDVLESKYRVINADVAVNKFERNKIVKRDDQGNIALTQAGGRFALDTLRPFQLTQQDKLTMMARERSL